MSKTTLDFIRHGEPVGGKRYRGDQIDDPLNARGWQQMQQRIEQIVALGEDDWDCVITSPLQRCQAFAAQLAEQRGLEWHIEPRLREIGFGCWEGLTHQQIPQRYPEQFAAFRADPVAGRPQGAEDMRAFYQRVEAGMAAIVEQHPDQRVLIICHAVVIRAALGLTLNAPLQSVAQIETEYACWLRVQAEAEGRWRLGGLENLLPNQGHLPQAAIT